MDLVLFFGDRSDSRGDIFYKKEDKKLLKQKETIPLFSEVFCVLFLSVKAISTYLAWLQWNGSQKVIQPVVMQGSEIQLFGDFLQHFLVILRIRICISIQNLTADVLTFSFCDDPSGDQIHLRFGT